MNEADPRTSISVPTPATVAARLSTVRREVVLPDEALVVRGGTLRLGDLHRAAEVARVKMKRPGLSVFAADVGEPAALVAAVASTLHHTSLSFTTVGRLREKGFELEQTGDPPHHTVWLPESEDQDYWVREFRMSFDRPVRRDALQGYRVGYH